MGLRWIDEVKKDIVRSIIVAETMDKRSLADQQTIEMRKRACANCDKNISGKCQICGCYLEIKWETKVNFNPKKLKNEITHCPLGKWEDKLIVNFLNLNLN